MAFLKGIDREQTLLFPVTIEEMIPAEHPVRIIDLFIETLNLEKLGFIKTIVAIEGRPSYDPKDLLKLYLYGYLNRIRTSRLLERECERNVELMWLLRGLKPCFRTIAGFRSENSQGLKNLFRHFVQLLKSWNLVDDEVVAIDSSKFRAVNSKKNNFNPRKIERQLEYIDSKIERYLIDMTEADALDQSTSEITQDILKQLGRQEKYLDIKQKLEASGEDQISTTDPDARSMILHGSVIEVAYNVQTAVTENNKLIVHFDVTNDNDKKALHPVSNETKHVLGKQELTVLADKGYHNAEQLNACKENGIVTYVAVPEIPRKNAVPTENYYGEKFNYDKAKDKYTCPQGKSLHSNGNWYVKKYKRYVTKVRQYKTSACGTCPARTECTTNPRGRMIERSQYSAAIEENGNRMRSDLKKYLLRQQIVEHPFGTIKRQWGMDHILLKGIKKNNGEFGLIYFTYNFRRVMNILGYNELMKRLQKLFFSSSSLICFGAVGIVEIIYEWNSALRSRIVNRNFISFGYCTNCRYEKVLKGARKVYMIDRPKKEKKLPDVLNEEEIFKLIKMTDNLKHKTILMLAYSSGLRLGELINLRIKDIDSSRMQIRVEQSKGKKDRYSILSNKMLEILREYYKQYKPKEWLFEGEKGGQYSSRSLQLVVKAATQRAGIKKKVGVHTLRHTFATHLLENGTDLRYIQSLLGHESSRTTEIYTHITTKGFDQIKNPLDKLNF